MNTGRIIESISLSSKEYASAEDNTCSFLDKGGEEAIGRKRRTINLSATMPVTRRPFETYPIILPPCARGVASSFGFYSCISACLAVTRCAWLLLDAQLQRAGRQQDSTHIVVVDYLYFLVYCLDQ